MFRFLARGFCTYIDLDLAYASHSSSQMWGICYSSPVAGLEAAHLEKRHWTVSGGGRVESEFRTKKDPGYVKAVSLVTLFTRRHK